MRHVSSGQGMDGGGWPRTVEDGRGMSKTAGNGEGRQGTAGDDTSDVS